MSSRILVIDDDPFWREQFRDVLIEMGFDVDIANKIKDAKVLLAQDSYALVLYDAALDRPDLEIDSQNFLATLKQRTPNLPVVATTGKELPPPQMWTLFQLGVVDFVYKKGFDLPNFQQRVHTALSKTGHNLGQAVDVPAGSVEGTSGLTETDPEPVERTRLRQFLIRHFSLGELKNLASDLGIDHELLPYDNKEDFARELIAHCERRGKLTLLRRESLRQRKDE